MQKRTSANTSVNGSKFPAVYGKIKSKLKNGETVFDYGCGKYPEMLKEMVEGYGAKWYGYDPYNVYGTTEELLNGVDIGICANVLNVIDDDEEMENIIHTVCDHSDVAFFQIYEGDAKGVGRESKKDCWQRNEPTSNYLERFSTLGYQAIKSGNIITVTR